MMGSRPDPQTLGTQGPRQENRLAGEKNLQKRQHPAFLGWDSAQSTGEGFHVRGLSCLGALTS